MKEAASLLRELVENFAKLVTLEMGKRIDEARGEVKFSADILNCCPQHVESFLAPQKIKPQILRSASGKDAAGCAVLCRTLEFSVLPAGVRGGSAVDGRQYAGGRARGLRAAMCNGIRVVAAGCGGASGFHTNLVIPHDQSEKVIEDHRIEGVALTGSVAAGRSIAARAGKGLKKSSMELGGSDVFIVPDDADLAVTIPWAVWGRTYNGGQTCCAAKRFIVLDSIADEFTEQFKTASSALKAGGPMLEATTHGPLSSEATRLQLVKQVDEAVAHGANVLMGGRHAASQVDTGMMFVNNIDWTDAELPFGGIKYSGYGRELGNMGIQEFVNKKLVRTVVMNAPA